MNQEQVDQWERASLRSMAQSVVEAYGNDHKHDADKIAACMFCRKWLEEHPADDDEPVTGEWLKSIGFDGEGSLKSLDAEGDPCLLDWDGGTATMSVSPTHTDPWVCFPADTRRDVRQLLAALGYEVTG